MTSLYVSCVDIIKFILLYVSFVFVLVESSMFEIRRNGAYLTAIGGYFFSSYVANIRFLLFLLGTPVAGILLL